MKVVEVYKRLSLGTTICKIILAGKERVSRSVKGFGEA